MSLWMIHIAILKKMSFLIKIPLFMKGSLFYKCHCEWSILPFKKMSLLIKIPLFMKGSLFYKCHCEWSILPFKKMSLLMKIWLFMKISLFIGISLNINELYTHNHNDNHNDINPTSHMQYTGEYNTGGNRRMQIQAVTGWCKYRR